MEERITLAHKLLASRRSGFGKDVHASRKAAGRYHVAASSRPLHWLVAGCGSESGQDVTEYALLTALFVAVTIVALEVFGVAVNQTWEYLREHLALLLAM